MRHALAVVIGVSLTACVSARSTTSGETMLSRGSAARNVLTAAEIVAARVSDVYQAVSQLRPDFLRRRASVQPMSPLRSSSVVVYLDGLPFGNVESLRHIPLERVRVIHYISPFDADLRWGGSHPAGAILVTTMKR